MAKNRTSLKAVAKYRKKTYTQVPIVLRKVDDKDILDYIEYKRSKGESPTQMFRRLVTKDMSDNVGDDVFPDFE